MYAVHLLYLSDFLQHVAPFKANLKGTYCAFCDFLLFLYCYDVGSVPKLEVNVCKTSGLQPTLNPSFEMLPLLPPRDDIRLFVYAHKQPSIL